MSLNNYCVAPLSRLPVPTREGAHGVPEQNGRCALESDEQCLPAGNWQDDPGKALQQESHLGRQKTVVQKADSLPGVQ